MSRLRTSSQCSFGTDLPFRLLKSVDSNPQRTKGTVEFSNMPGLTSTTEGKYNQIPGPLGLASASLEGKVALVTGAGTYLSHSIRQGSNAKTGSQGAESAGRWRWSSAAAAQK